MSQNKNKMEISNSSEEEADSSDAKKAFKEMIDSKINSYNDRDGTPEHHK